MTIGCPGGTSELSSSSSFKESNVGCLRGKLAQSHTSRLQDLLLGIGQSLRMPSGGLRQSAGTFVVPSNVDLRNVAPHDACRKPSKLSRTCFPGSAGPCWKASSEAP
jgi:hypothetical protein